MSGKGVLGRIGGAAASVPPGTPAAFGTPAAGAGGAGLAVLCAGTESAGIACELKFCGAFFAASAGGQGGQGGQSGGLGGVAAGLVALAGLVAEVLLGAALSVGGGS